ncbi:MAG TPA: heparinase II/III-family protein, partial [Usitatibacter sp.]|nr:heparinase II/III-family protein [Usitatibacter sp.]
RGRMEAMLEYLASIMDAGGNLPMFGDADDGYVVRLDPRPQFCRYRSLLATGAVLFGRPELKAKAGALDDKTRWLLGPEAQSAFARMDASAARLPVRRAFPEGGYYILGCDFETPRELRLVADAGPLGYREIAAHGHADALSFTLSVGGREMLVDPGTYAYHTRGDWRAYFRGTSAHNTLRVDRRDQSQPGGNFMWLRKARAACSLWRSSEDEDVFEGVHDGYRALADPVTHRRRITLDKRSRRIVIDDTLEMDGEHDIELFFHCHEACEVRAVPGAVEIERDGVRLRLALPAGSPGAARVLRGSVAPIAGWVSRRFDRKVASPTIVWRARLAGRCVLKTVVGV